MLKNKNTLIFVLVLVFSVISANLVVYFKYFPYLGFSLFFIGLSSLVYFLKVKKDLFDFILFICLITLSLFLAIRSNGFLTFINIISILYLGAVLSLKKEEILKFLNLIFGPMLLFLKTLIVKNTYNLNIQDVLGKENEQLSKKTSEILISLGITFVALIVIVPLLASSNPLFDLVVKEFFSFFRFTLDIEFFVRLGFIAFILFFVLKVLSYVSSEDSEKFGDLSPFTLNLTIPIVAIAFVVGVFFITQLQLYFSTTEIYSLSQKTNEVFGQLSVVCITIFLILYNNKSKGKVASYASLVLFLEVAFLITVAFKSDLDYTSTWGLTHKRLYGYAILLWILGVYVLFIKNIIRKVNIGFFWEQTVVYTAGLLILINFVNFDSLIYKVNPSTHVQKFDHVYLSELSADSGNHYEHLIWLDKELVSGNVTSYTVDAYYKELWFLTSLQEKYDAGDIRTFNIAEHNEYLKVKNINLDDYFTKAGAYSESLVEE